MSTDSKEAARVAYAFYKNICDSLKERGGVSVLSFDELNGLYNIALKARRDADLAAELALCEGAEGEEPLADRIDALLSDYSVIHGVDIRGELYEVKEATGTIYFKAETDRDAHDYHLGDSITFRITARDKENGQIASCDTMEYT